MTFLSDTAPWGSPTVESIPVPPFESADEHRRFTRMLQLHLALVDVGGPALPTVALSAAIEAGHAADAASPWPTSLELEVSLTSWFPAPWSPGALARALAAVGRDAPTQDGAVWRWGNDPDFLAEPESSGSWVITRHERGSRGAVTVASDRDLVVAWIDYYRSRFVVPWGVRFEEADAEALAAASFAVLEADAADARYPYRSSWSDRRAELLAAVRRCAAESQE